MVSRSQRPNLSPASPIAGRSSTASVVRQTTTPAGAHRPTYARGANRQLAPAGGRGDGQSGGALGGLWFGVPWGT
jgi:hypothetical protein